MYFSSWSHVDPTYCPFTFTFCTDRQVVPTPSLDAISCDRPDSKLCASVSREEEKDLWPDTRGSSFVDLSLKVVVKQERGTLMAFRSNFLHGTTLACGATNRGMAIAFSQRVVDLWKEARGNESVEAYEGGDSGVM